MISNSPYIQRIAEIIRRQYNLSVILVTINDIIWLGTRQNIQNAKCDACIHSAACYKIYTQWLNEIIQSNRTNSQYLCHQNMAALALPIYLNHNIIATLFISGLDKQTQPAVTDREMHILIELQTEIALEIQSQFQSDDEQDIQDEATDSLSNDLLNPMIASKQSIKALAPYIKKASHTDVPILISGEQGVGKELTARTIHRQSNRKHGPFITFECSIYSDEQAESELFGHKRGAFPGALTDKPGLLDIADKGTLYLNHIDALSHKCQYRILQLIQSHTFTPAGDIIPHHSDVRIIAAVEQADSLMDSSHFNQELYDILNMISIPILPLNQRSDDIIPLANHFLKLKNKKNHKQIQAISPEAMKILKEYSWPGNVSELEVEIERMVILSPDQSILQPDIISQRIQRSHIVQTEGLDSIANTTDMPIPPIEMPAGSGLQDAMDEIEKRIIQGTLVRNQGNRSKAAEILGISRRNLIRKIEKLGIDG